MLKRNFLVLFSLLGLVLACKKDHRVLDTAVQPDADLLDAKGFEGYPVYGHSTKADSVISYNTDIKYLGSNNDPNFGRTDVGLYLNPNMSVTGLNFGNKTFVSSEIILYLGSGARTIGKKDAVISFSVFALDSTLNSTRAYYTSNTRLYNKSKLLGSTSAKFSFYSGKPVLRLPLADAFAQEIMANPQYLVDNATFQDRYKGFYIKADCGSDEGIIYEVDLSDDASGFYIRYKENASATDTLNFRWSFAGTNEKAARFNTVLFQPNAAVNAQFQGDTAQGAQGLYLRSFGSSRGKIYIPFLKNYSDSFKVAVSRAEVVFKVDPDYAAYTVFNDKYTYRLPPSLALMAIDSLGREQVTADEKNSTYVSRYGGVYDAEKSAYVFNIALHAQEIMRGLKKNRGFYLVITDPTPPLFLRRDNQMYSVKLAGSGQAGRAVFNISYLKFPKD